MSIGPVTLWQGKNSNQTGYFKMEYVWVRLAISWHEQFYALKCHVYCYISNISCWIRSFTSDPITVKQPTGPSKSKHFSNQGLTARWPTVTHHILSRPSAPYQEGALSPQSPQTRFVGVVGGDSCPIAGPAATCWLASGGQWRLCLQMLGKLGLLVCMQLRLAVECRATLISGLNAFFFFK